MPRIHSSVSVDAPAKINLSLEVLGERPDGYHNLRSVIVPVSLYDTIRVSHVAESGGVISCETAGDGVHIDALADMPHERHLAVRAARALAAAAGRSDSVHIEVTKRIPIGAGMGGGSADAAGTLTALNRLWGLGLDHGRLAQIGATIGCDVPPMILGGAVSVEDTGIRATRILAEKESAPPFWLVAVFPEFSISTARIFKNCGTCLTAPSDTVHSMRSFVRSGDARGASRWLFNGLQETVFKLYPETERFYQALRGAGVLSVLVSGSGAAIFGLAENREHAERVKAGLCENIDSRVLQTLPDGVMVAHGPLVP